MKKLYAVLLLSSSVSFANAAIVAIAVQASSFSPASATAQCGDTVVWGWAGSGTHTTTSTTIPGCATPWNAPISAASFSFAITVPCTGTYNYVCSPHGFTGTIVVTGSCGSGVSSLDLNYISSSYPNPFNNKVTIEFPYGDMISLFNVVGEQIKTIALQRGQTKAEIISADLKQGIYFYSIYKEGVAIESRKIIKN